MQRRLESMGSAHESRLTEMHCVIAELTKKLKYQQDNAILEDQEPDGSHSGTQKDDVYERIRAILVVLTLFLCTHTIPFPIVLRSE